MKNRLETPERNMSRTVEEVQAAIEHLKAERMWFTEGEFAAHMADLEDELVKLDDETDA